MSKRLTPRHAMFVMAYITTGNGTEAARLAGYHQTDQALAVTGMRLLRNAQISAAVDAMILENARRVGICPDVVMARLWKEATYYGEGASHGARVSALRDLARILGMEKFTVDVRTEAAPDPREVLSQMMKSLSAEQLRQWRGILETMRAAQAKQIEYQPQESKSAER